MIARKVWRMPDYDLRCPNMRPNDKTKLNGLEPIEHPHYHLLKWALSSFAPRVLGENAAVVRAPLAHRNSTFGTHRYHAVRSQCCSRSGYATACACVFQMEQRLMQYKMMQLGGLDAEADEMDSRLRNMKFGDSAPEKGKEADKSGKYNMIWLCGILWLSQSEDYLQALQRPMAYTRVDASSRVGAALSYVPYAGAYRTQFPVHRHLVSSGGRQGPRFRAPEGRGRGRGTDNAVGQHALFDLV